MTKNKIAALAFLITVAPAFAFAQTTTTTIVTDPAPTHTSSSTTIITDPAPAHTSSSTTTSTQTRTVEQQKLKKHMTPDNVNAHEAEREMGRSTEPKPTTVIGGAVSTQSTTTTTESHSAY